MLLALTDPHPCVAFLPCLPEGPEAPAAFYPQALVTIGDHLRRRLLDLGLLQREVADRLRADPCSVTNWELNRTKPALWFLPGIVQFIGYVPWTTGVSLGERLLAARREHGLSQESFARLLGIDPGTLGLWERNRRAPAGRSERLAEAFTERLATGPPDVTGAPRIEPAETPEADQLPHLRVANPPLPVAKEP